MLTEEEENALLAQKDSQLMKELLMLAKYHK